MAAASETFISPFFPIVRHDLGLDVSNQATLIAVLTSGIGLGNLIGGAAGYHVGDRLVVRAAALSMSIGALVCATSQSFWQLLLGQAISGLGIGVFFAPGLASVGRMFAATHGAGSRHLWPRLLAGHRSRGVRPASRASTGGCPST